MDIAEERDPEEEYNITPQVSTKKRRIKRLSKGIKKREKANDRERSRMADIRGGFKLLRKSIPGKYAPTFKYLPKIQILRYAMMYISELSEILQSDEVQEVDFSGKSYPLHKTAKLPVEETVEETIEETVGQFESEFTPPASDNEGENIIFRFDDISIPQLQSSTNEAVDKDLEAENTNFNSVEYLQSLPGGYLTPDVQSPGPFDMTPIDNTDEFQIVEALEELLKPTSIEDETFNIEDYLKEDICSPCREAEDTYNKQGVFPDFSDLLTPIECDEILNQFE